MNNVYQTLGSAALKSEYVTDIPWERAPLFAGEPEEATDLQLLREQLELLPQIERRVSFNEGVWNFTNYFRFYKEYLSFDFTSLPEDLGISCKFFVLYKMAKNIKLTSISGIFNNFRRIYVQIVQAYPSKTIQTITTDDIISTIEHKKLAPSTKGTFYENLYQVLSFLSYNCHMNLPVDLVMLDSLHHKYRSINMTLDTKVPNIPEEYFNIILNKSIEVMRDANAFIDMRMTAAALVLLSQTGIRISEFLALTTDRLLTKKLHNSNIEVNYIHYTAFKQSKHGYPLLEFDVFCSAIGAEAFSIMRELRQNIDAENKGNSLFVVSSPIINRLPYSKCVFYNSYKKFMAKYLYSESTHAWEGISPLQHNKITLYIPETRQYRVHLCSTLYNKGVSLVYIRKYMGHLSQEMMGYYVRPKDNYQENIRYSEMVLQEIAGEDLTPLGGNFLGEDIKNNIKKFIRDNNFDVYSDIDKIIKAFGDKVVIRGKMGGVCIKTSLVPCSKDSRTNKLLCAHSVCPNLFHFYYMLDITYVDFKTLQEAYVSNKKSGHTKAAQKELAKLKDLIERRLIPELDELDKECDRKGRSVIISKHPTLIDIVERRDEIRKEAEEWKLRKEND